MERRITYPHIGAFESTKLSATGKDILGTTRHIERWRYDLELLLKNGIRTLRYSVPWHRIEREPGRFDFSWMDGPMRFFHQTGITPILDPLHHISFPDWLTNGMANPELGPLYERFVLAVAERYPWVTQYTVINEPLPTTVLCGYRGVWHPHGNTDGEFVRMAVNVAHTICRVSHALRRFNPDIQFIHVDTCETHRPIDRESEEWAAHANDRRYMMHDLILGRVNRGHPLYAYLSQNGMTDDDTHRLASAPAPIDILGLDYYLHCEMEWYFDQELGRPNIAWPSVDPVGFALIADEYARRFGLPVMLSETNIRGTFRDRLSWLKYMEGECEGLAALYDFRGFCWYPSIDSTDWCNACTEATGTVDPQGIWGLNETRWERVPSELSRWFSRLASGTASANDLPAYEFSEGLEKDVVGFRKLMTGWDWQPQDELPRAA